MSSLIGNSTAAIAIGLDVFNEYFRHLHSLGALRFSGVLPPSSWSGFTQVTVEVSSAPHLHISRASGDPQLLLDIEGHVAFSDPLSSGEFSVVLRMNCSLETSGDGAPGIVMAFDGVQQVTPSLLPANQVDSILQGVGLADKLSLRFDSLVSRIVGELEGQLFDDQELPSRSAWAFKLELRRSAPDQSESLVVFLAAPLSAGEGPISPMTTVGSVGDTELPFASSFLPANLGFGIVVGKTGMDRMFARQSARAIGTTANGATVREQQARLDRTQIYVRGRATRTGATIRWSGHVTADLQRGAVEWVIDTSGINIDVDRAWWVRFIEFGGLGILPAIPFAIYTELNASGAAEKVRNRFTEVFDSALSDVSTAFGLSESTQQFRVTATEREGRIEGYALVLFSNLVLSPVIPDLRGMWHSNLGFRFDITQPLGGDTSFTWTVRERSMPGTGMASGEWLRARWSDFGNPLDDTGSVEVADDGRATRISFNSGLALAREPIDFNPYVARFTPDVRGLWYSNVGLIFDIVQSEDGESRISWTERHRPIPAEGTIDHLRARITWRDFGVEFNSAADIEIQPGGCAVTMRFGNGLVLSRSRIPFDSSVKGFVPDLRGVWDSNIGLVFDISQDSESGQSFTWTVRQRPMPGRGTLEGLRVTRVEWNDAGDDFAADGEIEIGPRAWATRLALSNGVELVRARVVDLAGSYRSNIGLTFELRQSHEKSIFDWVVRERPMPGRGETMGSWLTVKWRDFDQDFEAVGTVLVDAMRRATTIFLSNGAVLTREEPGFTSTSRSDDAGTA